VVDLPRVRAALDRLDACIATHGDKAREICDRLAAELPGAGRNRRSVWQIASQPYRGAHFAVMPPALAEPCILAGCPEDGIVLDPFAGSGTVGRVAVQHRRRAVLCDISREYLTGCAMERTAGIQVEMGLGAA
jgi:hypothetical protein